MSETRRDEEHNKDATVEINEPTPKPAGVLYSSVRIGLVVVFYWVVSMNLVFANKWVMKNYNFNYPLFVTWIQLLVAEVFIIVFGFLSPRVPGFSLFAPLEWDWVIAKKVLPLTFVWMLMMASSNICLRYTEVTFYQVVRALTLIWSIFLQRLEFPEFQLSNMAMMACLVIFIGFVMGSVGELQFNWEGWFAGVASSAFVAYYNNSIKRSLAFVENSTWRLMIYNTTMAIFMFIPLVWISGEMVIIDNPEILTTVVWEGVIGSGVLGYLINIAIFLQMNLTSPLTGTISGTVKAVLQVIFGWLLFRNPVSPLNGAGIVLVVLGSAWYSYIRYKKMVEKLAPAPQPQSNEREG